MNPNNQPYKLNLDKNQIITIIVVVVIILGVYFQMTSVSESSDTDRFVVQKSEMEYNNKSLSLEERVLKFADYYVKNNLRSFAGNKMKVHTSDIYPNCDYDPSSNDLQIFVFNYSSYTDDLSYLIDGEVIIKYDRDINEVGYLTDNVYNGNNRNIAYPYLMKNCSGDKIKYKKYLE